MARLRVQHMPASTQRAHFDPSWKGDNPAALVRVSKYALGKDGIRAIDCNFQWAWTHPERHLSGGEAFCLHWAIPAANRYFFLLTSSGKVRRMTVAELRRPISEWHADQVRNWRRLPKANSSRPPAYGLMVKEAVKQGVYICAELKSTSFGSALPANHVVEVAKKAGHPPWFMALYKSMPACDRKCDQIIRHGGQFAVIFGTFQRYRSDFARARKSWPTQPTRVW